MHREPGTYLVQVTEKPDAEAARFGIGADRRNAGTRDGVEFVVTRGNVTVLPPPPATGDDSGA